MHALALFAAFLFATCSALDAASRSSRASRPARFEGVRYGAATGEMRARRAGDGGRRIVFVHGTPGDAGAWDAYLDDPPAGWEAFAIDRPGFGASAPSGHVASLALQAAALEPLIAGTERGAVLVGHSLGAAVVARAAVDYPEHVAGIVLLAGSIDPALERLRWYNLAALPVEWLLPRSLRNANREVRAFARELRELEARLDELRCPVLVMHGTRDNLVPYANVDFVRRSVRAPLEVITLDGGSHFFIWSDGERVRRELGRFLERLPGLETGGR